jgi:nucleotide-binding universal stress UspA family protein
VTRNDSGPVVVAVGDDVTGSAVDWAAAEAAARRCGLHIVHAERLRWAVDPSGLVPVADFWSCRATAVDVLRDAVRRARAVAPDVDVVAELAFGPPAPSLLLRSRAAQLLVLGRGNAVFRSRLRNTLAPSVCGRVAGRSHCPVAVVRPLRSDPQAGSAPRVVVGVDGTGCCAPALAVAFRAAAQREVPLTAVHAWAPDAPADHEAVCGAAAASKAHAEELLDQALEPWRMRFPIVPVATRLSIGNPADVVIRESEGAALVVVGSRGRGAVRSRLFGSVSRVVTERARCPVVVVPPCTATAHEHSRRRTTVAGIDPPGVQPFQRRRTPWA